jgi:phosphotransferase system HPr (HPr) family protein
MQEVTLIIRNKVGLDARRTALFVQTAKKFASTITISKGERQANAKSILAVITLGATMGSQVTIRATGQDEEEAVKTLQGLVESNFGEPEEQPSDCSQSATRCC